jgi:hypothetical protein
MRTRRTAFLILALGGCGGGQQTLVAGSWVDSGIDFAISLDLHGTTDQITGTGTFFSANSGSQSPFTVTGSDQMILFHYQSGSVDTFNYVHATETTLQLFFTAAPNSGGFAFQRRSF